MRTILLGSAKSSISENNLTLQGPSKYCTRCHRALPISAFYASEGSHMSYCKPCRKEYQRQYRLDCKPSLTHICSKCKEELPLSDFNNYKHIKQGYCKQCTRMYLIEWNKKKKEAAVYVNS